MGKLLTAVSVLALSAASAPALAASLAEPANKTAATERHYDCSKAGNKDKAVCKEAAAASAQAGEAETAAPRHYDCSKPGNADKKVCKDAAAAVMQSAVEPAVHKEQAEASAPVHHAEGHEASVNSNPAGAIAMCKDGTYSHSHDHRGACADHGGVAKWLQQ